MNNKDNLKESLKKAFESYNEPLLQHQWERLNLDLKNQKKKSHLTLGNMVIVAVLLFLGSIIGFYFKQNTSNSQVSNTSVSKNEESNRGSKSIEVKTLAEAQHLEIPNNESKKTFESKLGIKQASSEGLQQNKMTYSNSDLKTINNQNETIDWFSKSLKLPVLPIIKQIEVAPELNGEEIVSIDGIEDSKADKEEAVSTIESKVLENMDLETVVEKNEQKDSVKKSTKRSVPQPENKSTRSKFAVSLSYGMSNVKTASSRLENGSAMHKDGERLFNESEKGKESQVFNLGFEFYVRKNFNLIIQTGTQYREITNTEKIDYSYSDIPFREVDGTIIGYFRDTINPLRITSSNILKRRYVTIPIQFAYNFAIAPKHELQPCLGLNVNKLLAASGNSFSVNDGEVKPLSSTLSKKINVGMIAGLQYNYNVMSHWWLGIGAQWQQNIQNSHFGYSQIKSKINQYNSNIVLKYKF